MSKKKINTPTGNTVATASKAVEVPKQADATSPTNVTKRATINKWMAALVVAIIAFATFWNTHKNTFVLDDHGIIKNNKVTKAGISAENIKVIFTTSLRKGDVTDLEKSLYRPLAKLIFAAEWDAFGDKPGPWHVWNVIFYALCCVLLFFVAYHTFKQNWIPALATSILFAVHPIHSETVANVKSLDEILGLIGVLGSILCCHQYATKEKFIWLIPAGLLFLCGLLGKESAITALPLMPLFIYYFSNGNKKQLINVSACMFIVAALWFGLRSNADVEKIKEPSALDNVLALTKKDVTKEGNYDITKSFPTVLHIMGFYMYTLFVPYPLSCDYSYKSIDVKGFTDGSVWFSLIFYLGIIFYAVKTFLSKSPIGYGIIFFLLSSALASNITVIFGYVIGTSFGERLMFAPSAGWAIAVVGTIYFLLGYAKKEWQNLSFIGGLQKHIIMFGVIGLVSFFYAQKAISRNAEWKTDRSLFSTDVKNYPNSTHLLFYWGNHVSSDEYSEGQNEDYKKNASKEAIETFKRCMDIYPALPSDGYNQYGKAYYNLGFYDSAYYYYLKAHREDTTNAVFMNNVGTIYFQRTGPYQRIDFLDSAYKYFTAAYAHDSTVIDYQNNIGAILGTKAQRPEAIKWFYKGYKTDSLSQGAILSCRSIAVTYRDMGDSNSMRAWMAKADEITKYRLQQIQEKFGE